MQEIIALEYRYIDNAKTLIHLERAVEPKVYDRISEADFETFKMFVEFYRLPIVFVEIVK